MYKITHTHTHFYQLLLILCVGRERDSCDFNRQSSTFFTLQFTFYFHKLLLVRYPKKKNKKLFPSFPSYIFVSSVMCIFRSIIGHYSREQKIAIFMQQRKERNKRRKRRSSSSSNRINAQTGC